MKYSVRWWSLGRLYTVADLDVDTANCLYDIFNVNGLSAELWRGLNLIKSTKGWE